MSADTFPPECPVFRARREYGWDEGYRVGELVTCCGIAPSGNYLFAELVDRGARSLGYDAHEGWLAMPGDVEPLTPAAVEVVEEMERRQGVRP